MPNWKKIALSGSNPEFASLNVDNAVTASAFTGSFTGDGSGLTGLSVTQTATVSDTFTSTTSKSVTHNFGTKNVIVQVYDNSDNIIIPQSVTTSTTSSVDIVLDSATTGRVVVAKGGHIVSGSVDFNSLSNTPTLLSSSAQIATDISGSSTSLSSSLASRVAANESFSSSISTTPITYTGSFVGDGTSLTGVTSYTDSDTLSYINSVGVLSGSAQIAADISGSFVSASNALGTRIDNVASTITLSADVGSNDTYTTGETLTFTGDNSITTTVSDNTITFTLGDGVVSSSAQVVSLVEAGSDSNTFTDADHTKLNGIEASADVTDTTNVTAAGAVMDSELTNEAAVKAINQGLATGDDVTFATVTTTGDVTIAGDLNVTGDTIQAQVTNLNVEDKFILLNSGSTSGDAGIVFGGAGGSTANTGDGIFYDDSDSVFAYAENIASNATTATNASKLGNIEVASSNPSSAPTFQGIGTIHINDSDEGIWIYS